MVVGAYTIINTIGLLVGLPLNITTTNNSPVIDINNNSNVITKETFTDYYLIVDTENASDFSSSWNGNFYLSLSHDTTSFDFVWSSRIDNYLIYTHDSIEDTYNYGNYKLRFDFSTGIDFSSQDLIINQVYLARLTSSLQPINGDSIIDSITSGLGLMGDITTNFKNGFSALIWNSEKNSLTTFGNFALIFLGVSITFAIVKLCLSLIRSKTGA